MRYENLLPIFAAFLISCNSLIAQQLRQNEPSYKWFDAMVGIENTGLYEGVFYKEQYRTINKNTQFFPSPGFHPGNVVYNSQVYVELRLKYNVYADQLLLRVQDRLGGSTLQLFREKVSEFTIDGHSFTRIPEGNATVMPGFYEISVQTPSLRLLTKHNKKLYDRKDRSSLYYEFLDIKKSYLLHYQGTYHPINNKRDVTEMFPRLEKQINDYYNRARVLRRTEPHSFTIGLIQRIGSLLPQPNSSAIR